MVAETVAREVGGLFDGLLAPEVIDAYERLQASGGCPKDQAEDLFGAGLVDVLTHWGMVHVRPHSPADPAWLQPTSPDLALQGVLAGHQHRLARDQELLLDGQRRLPGAQARFGASMNGNGRLPEHLVAVVTDRRQISDLSASLVNTAHQDWMTLENLATDMPLTGDFTQPPLPAAGGQVRCRSIYAAAAMDDPAARQIIHDLRRGRGAGPAAAQRADEDEARRHEYRHASLDAEWHRGRAHHPRAGDHHRAAGVLRVAVGPRHPAQADAVRATR